KRALEVREAPHQVRHQGRAETVGPRRLKRGRDPLYPVHRLSSASASARSLSPRPERHTRSASLEPHFNAKASAWADSSAGMIPSRRDVRANASSASPSVTAK